MTDADAKVGEVSKGKARPALRRASDLRTHGTEGKPTGERDADGRFLPGNRTALQAGFKHTVKKSLGTSGDSAAGIVAGDAAKVASHILRSLPSDAAPVRVLVTIHARHVALHAYYTHLAEVAGLETEVGQSLLVVADRQSARAERTLVTALDVARVCSSRRPEMSAADVIRAEIAKVPHGE